ncbi:hypothetical protein [Oceanobacillus kapialis]|uniref:DUF1700 domain-containing protein n=1 Tax=Oceanobacillus kapialis TaxID=481353 RepID=A0ABW5Q5R4_9BACI
MSEERISTIVNEIHYWKEHHLLPDTYCDFLLALYTNGEGVPDSVTKQVSTGSRMGRWLQIVLVSFLVPFSFYVHYFTPINLFWQIGMILLFLCYSSWTYISVKKRNEMLYHVSLITSIFLMFFMTLLIGKIIPLEGTWLSIAFAVNFIGWILLGKYFKQNYLIIIGIIALLFTFLYTIL